MLKISGYSDDVVSLDGIVNDEVGAYERAVQFTLAGDGGGLFVRMQYAPKFHPGGVWVATVAPLDEDIPIPWPVSITLSEQRYSPVVEIGCPKGTVVTWTKRKVGS